MIEIEKILVYVGSFYLVTYINQTDILQWFIWKHTFDKVIY